jgi:hypothetical protein
MLTQGESSQSKAVVGKNPELGFARRSLVES